MKDEELLIEHRTELVKYFDSILPIIRKKKIKAILPYNTWIIGDPHFLEYPVLQHGDNIMVFDTQCAIIFEDDTFLSLSEKFISSAVVGLHKLTQKDLEQIASFSTKDLFNDAMFIAGIWTIYSFDYSTIEAIDIETVDYPVDAWIDGEVEYGVMLPDAFGTITFRLANGNELIFSPEEADMDGYMDLTVKGLKVERPNHDRLDRE